MRQVCPVGDDLFPRDMKRVSRETPRAIMSDTPRCQSCYSNNNGARSYTRDTARTSKRVCRRGQAIISNSVCAYAMGRRVNGHDVRWLHMQPRREIPRRFVCARRRNNILRGCTTARKSFLDRACLSSVRPSSLERSCFPFSFLKVSFSRGESTPKLSRMCPDGLTSCRNRWCENFRRCRDPLSFLSPTPIPFFSPFSYLLRRG